MPAIPLSAKEFRHLAQGMQSITMAGAVIAAVALAWYALKTYQRAQGDKGEGQGEAQ